MRTFAEFMPEPAGSQQQAGTKINSDELIHTQMQSGLVNRDELIHTQLQSSLVTDYTTF